MKRTSPFNESGNLLFLNGVARTNYYLASYKILHPYLGAGIGFNVGKEKYASNGINYLQITRYYLTYEFGSGLRANINEHIALFGEIGLGLAPFQIGICAQVGNNETKK